MHVTCYIIYLYILGASHPQSMIYYNDLVFMNPSKFNLIGKAHVKVDFILLQKICVIPSLGRFIWTTCFVLCVDLIGQAVQWADFFANQLLNTDHPFIMKDMRVQGPKIANMLLRKITMRPDLHCLQKVFPYLLVFMS